MIMASKSRIAAPAIDSPAARAGGHPRANRTIWHPRTYPRNEARTVPATLLLLCLVVALLPAPGLADTEPSDLPAVVVHAAGYSGRWTPDNAANAKIAKTLRKQMRARMAKLGPPASPPGGGPSAGGGMPGGGMPGGGMPGGGPKGPPPDMPEMPAPNAVGLLRPEMDFAAPLEGDLFILRDEGMIAMGKDLDHAVILPYNRGAVDLGDDGLTALAMLSSGGLVVEFHTNDGVAVTHTYSLESDGTQLRIRTHIAGGRIPIPGGLDMERVYNRVQTTIPP